MQDEIIEFQFGIVAKKNYFQGVHPQQYTNKSGKKGLRIQTRSGTATVSKSPQSRVSKTPSHTSKYSETDMLADVKPTIKASSPQALAAPSHTVTTDDMLSPYVSNNTCDEQMTSPHENSQSRTVPHGHTKDKVSPPKEDSCMLSVALLMDPDLARSSPITLVEPSPASVEQLPKYSPVSVVAPSTSSVVIQDDAKPPVSSSAGQASETTSAREVIEIDEDEEEDGMDAVDSPVEEGVDMSGGILDCDITMDTQGRDTPATELQTPDSTDPDIMDTTSHSSKGTHSEAATTREQHKPPDSQTRLSCEQGQVILGCLEKPMEITDDEGDAITIEDDEVEEGGGGDSNEQTAVDDKQISLIEEGGGEGTVITVEDEGSDSEITTELQNKQEKGDDGAVLNKHTKEGRGDSHNEDNLVEVNNT